MNARIAALASFILLIVIPPPRANASEDSSSYLSPAQIKTNKDLYAEDQNSAQYQNALLTALGWVSTRCPSLSLSCSKCGGYYDQSHFPQPSDLNYGQATTLIKANQPIHYQINGDVVANNGIVIQQPGRTIYATQASITPNLKTGKLDAITATNGVRIEQPGQLVLARSFSANLVNNQAQFNEVNYLFRVSETTPQFISGPATIDPIFTGFAHGTAAKATQLTKDKYTFSKATYSTCAPISRTWELDASSIDIDQAKGEGQAYNVLLKAHHIPVFYLPYFNFPTTNRRKSGFLYPMVASNTNSGLSFSLPYYFNLAPNYDDILTPSVYSKSGILWDNTFRYLTASSSGSIATQFLLHDRNYNQQNRYDYSLNDTTTFNSNWNGNVNFNGVSDQNFFSDFSAQNMLNTNQVLLNRSGSLNYQNQHWQVQTLLQGYQVVNPSLYTANRPYNELPAITAKGQYPELLAPFTTSLFTSYVFFQKSNGYNPTPMPDPVQAQRINITPTITLPLTASYGYFTPALSFDGTFYNLSNGAANNYPNAHPDIHVPIFDIDTSLFFDRNLDIGSHHFTQTLVPRLFYLYVPYENQNNIPIFDTSINNFDFNQLFVTNRFSGLDRIGDANQLSYALTTSLNDEQGFPVISAGGGQIMYFANRQVSLCQNASGSTTPCIATENPFYNKTFSDVAGYFTYNFAPKWSFNANLAYNPNNSQMDAQAYTFQYLPNSLDVFNLSYQSNHQNYSLLSTQEILAGASPPTSSMVNASFIYGVTPSWALLGAINYSIENKGVINQLAGIQYSSCCWALRLIAYKYVTNNNPNTPNVLTGPTDMVYMVQFLLKGLGSVGNNQTGTLASLIPGYNNQLGF